MAMTLGATSKLNRSPALVPDVPPGVVTVTSTVPCASAGETAVIRVVESTTKLVASVPPKATALAPLRPVPLISTEVTPPTAPTAGLTAVTLGIDS